MIENEIAGFKIIKTHFELLVTIAISRGNETILGPLFLLEWPPSIFNKNNEVTIEDVFVRFIDEVKGEIEDGLKVGLAG